MIIFAFKDILVFPMNQVKKNKGKKGRVTFLPFFYSA